VPVQAKLKVNTPGDSSEQEADRVADGLTRKKDSCACGGKCSSCSSKVQRHGGTSTPESADVDPVLRGPSHSLDAHTRSFMEPHFGHDFSGVRVHSDPTAAASADSLGARAYTVGHHLIFGPGEYRPHTTDGQRLLAHELTHVTQQNAAGPIIQREPKPIRKGAASTSPTLRVTNVAPAKEPACACLVFMHHSEVNAREAAQAMYDECHYNLAMVDPKGDRDIDIPNVGVKDPNELFPRHIFRECVDDDKPCQDFISANKGTTDKDKTLEYVQRDFFLSIKHCSKDFSLPIVALHNNVVTDTAKYRKKMAATRTGLPAKIGKAAGPEKAKLQAEEADLSKIQGKTFQDTPPATGPYPAGTLPYADLEQWLRDHFPDLVQERDPAAPREKDRPTWKKKIESSKKGDLLSGGMTNIFKWCQAHDNSRCYIGDPDRPDNVVWVTREEDFKTLQGSKANVALQTRVTPGESETDLSSMFVGSPNEDISDRLQREPPAPAGRVPPLLPGASILDWLAEWHEEIVKRVDAATAQELITIAKRQAVQFVNIETPQSPSTPAQRVTNYQDVKSILQPLDLHCCDATEDAAVEAKLNPPKPAKKKPHPG
jgi:hypothetical protein